MTANYLNQLRQYFAPVLVTLILVSWTALVYPFTKYGDWEIWPAILCFPIALIWHMVIIIRLRDNRKAASIAALGHLGILFAIWMGCLMIISKDNL